jgi:pimeloyl-ACP methyl ester carboxylesterase
MPRPTEVLKSEAGVLEYRWDRRGPQTVVICHGGHLRAAVPVGEDGLADAGISVLVPSRRGYGRTRIRGGDAELATAVRHLCDHLGITSVVMIGISAGAPLAIRMTVRFPELVRGLVLQSARSSLPWPDLITNVTGQVAFHPCIQGLTWGGMHAAMTLLPGPGLSNTMGAMSTLPAHRVVLDLTAAERLALRSLFRRMSSGRGFQIDLNSRPDPDLERQVRRPTLVMASPTDGAMPFKHSQHLARTIPGAELWASPSLSHLIWYGTGARQTYRRTVDFVRAALGG